MPLQKKYSQNLQLCIQKLNPQAHGLALFTNAFGKTYRVEVPFALPGESVHVQLGKRRYQKIKGHLLSVSQPSSYRQKPICPHFSQCNGCRLQHMHYEQQVKYKQERLTELFSPLYKKKAGDIFPLFASPRQREYRNKMDFSFSQDLSKRRYLGLGLFASRGKVHDIKECALVPSWFEAVLSAVKTWWANSSLEAYQFRKDTGSLRSLTLREGFHTKDRLVMLTVSGNPKYALKKQHVEDFIASIQGACKDQSEGESLSIFLRIQQIFPGKPTQFYDMLLKGPAYFREELHFEGAPSLQKIRLRIGPTTFFQPQTLTAEKLYALALSFAALDEKSVVYDLYCGIAPMGLMAARMGVKCVVGIDLQKEAILDAQDNQRENALENMEFYWGDVASLLKEKVQSLPCPTHIILDPPRAGLSSDALSLIADLGAEKVIYVSCNPASQVRDVSVLMEKGNYCLSKMQAVDQFPHTLHVENIVLLSKNKDLIGEKCL